MRLHSFRMLSIWLTLQFFALLVTVSASAIDSARNDTRHVLNFNETLPPHLPIKPGTKLRVLPLGDSITFGYGSDWDGGDSNGYRLAMQQSVPHDHVVFAGTEAFGTMDDPYFAAWNGKTINFVAAQMQASLAQRPNMVLVHTGTNDVNPNPDISVDGDSPTGAAIRLGHMIDDIAQKCPDATILVAMIINTCSKVQIRNVVEFQTLIPGVVKKRYDQGKQVLAVNFTSFPVSMLRDCIHPTNPGYQVMGTYWYNFMAQVPKQWIRQPVGPDPKREDSGASLLSSGPFVLVAALAALLLC